MRREQERKEQERKKSPKVDFVSGGMQPPAVASILKTSSIPCIDFNLALKIFLFSFPDFIFYS
jgi:hypothetical protein